MFLLQQKHENSRPLPSSLDTFFCYVVQSPIQQIWHSLQFRFKYIASEDNFRRANRLLNITIIVNDALCLILTY